MIEKSWYISDEEVNMWEKIIPVCDVIFDVGCQNDNIFYDINPNVKEVHLFDPNVSDVLLNKIRDKKNIFFSNFGLGNINEEKEFYYYYGSFLHRTEEPKFNNFHQSKKTKIKRLYDYVNENNIDHIDFLKIDTEGFDFEVLKGCGDFINNIKYIEFENFINFYDNKKIDDIFNYFKDWNIYYVSGNPVNYLITKENIDFLKKIN